MQNIPETKIKLLKKMECYETNYNEKKIILFKKLSSELITELHSNWLTKNFLLFLSRYRPLYYI